MLGVIFRGIFLIGILTWYSTSVWKMIDSYFKDQFRSYLEEEYRKNPQMRSDIQSHSVADKVNPTVTTEEAKTIVVPSRKAVEVCELDECTVEAAENDSRRTLPNSTGEEEAEVTGVTSENEATKDGFTGKNAFSETPVELESRKPSYDNKRELEGSINHVDDLERAKKRSKVGDRLAKSKARRENPRKRTQARKEKKILLEEEHPEQTKQAKKRKVKIITLTQEDFETATRGGIVDHDDFWEFEEDAEEKEPVEGILVSELPFKPRADIGQLERVTKEEYCPLTLDPEEACERTVKWP